MGIVNTFKVKQAYVYAMNKEPWLNHILAMNHSKENSRRVSEPNLYIERCKEIGITAEQPYLKK